ncbi:calpain-like cysteine protease [Cavenderia fasciculata]|uniref:Calpain-like cysteine protease n=1 Tax=Cavenderia fasciculata TaxID=261658 RepID=F4Q335_CACFS|nr:calpain-like cysteine protease [Cavenderia fasciculata]EGG16757.1 calpain-like cysteine protease [Cavenderia fasciculata]|eukprot:XP_004355231.1 calpain-like cysteine protease [Cavenderia fasciculata]
MTTVEPTTTTSTTSTSSTSPVAVAAAPVVNIKDKNIFGTLEVKIKEVKGCQTHFLLAKCELAQKKSEVKTKSLSNHTFVDVFEFRVSSPNSEIEIEAWKKNLFFKDKITGKLTLSINDLLTANGEPKWMPLASNKKARRPRTGAAAGGNPSSPSSPDSDSSASKPADENAKENDVARGDTNSEGEKDTEEESPKSRARSVSLSAKKPKDPPEILLEIKFTKNEPPKEVLKGIILDGVWTADNSVGTLTNNPHWIKCAQYLLTIKNETSPITIKLRQPEGVDQPSTTSKRWTTFSAPLPPPRSTVPSRWRSASSSSSPTPRPLATKAPTSSTSTRPRPSTTSSSTRSPRPAKTSNGTRSRSRVSGPAPPTAVATSTRCTGPKTHNTCSP